MTTVLQRLRSSQSDPVRVGPARERIHAPTVLLGVLLVAGCALGFGLLAQRMTDGRPAVVVARPVERGQLVTAADLTVAQIAGGTDVHLLPPQAADQVVGHTALVALRPGSVVTPQLVTAAPAAVGEGSRTVGLLLEPGAYPIQRLAPGDIVTVVDAGGRGNILDADAMVVGVGTPLEGSAMRLIAVTVDPDVEAAVAAAASQDRVRLSLHGAAR